jgi:hypothetical protein
VKIPGWNRGEDVGAQDPLITPRFNEVMEIGEWQNVNEQTFIPVHSRFHNRRSNGTIMADVKRDDETTGKSGTKATI